MNELAMPSFAEIDEALSHTQLQLHPSQAHGLICGILCGNSGAPVWEKIISGSKETEATYQVLQQIYAMSAKQLDEFLFEFELVLPEEHDGLPVRAEALTLWCQGFLTGLKMVEVKLENHENPDLKEAVNDIVEIAKMNHEDVVASDDDEEAYVELVEYVRMAATYIYQDLRHLELPQKLTGSSSSQLH